MWYCTPPTSRTVFFTTYAARRRRPAPSSSRRTSSGAHGHAPESARTHAHDLGKPWPPNSNTQALIPLVGTPSHTQHPLACRWRKKMRGRRRTQEEHTKWSCLNLVSCSCSPLYRHTGQGENLQGMALQYNAAMTITCIAIYCGYYAQQSFAAQE